MWALLLLLKIILILFAALLLLLITLLVVPFQYKGEAAVYGGLVMNYQIGWFWNLFNIRGSRQEDVQTTAVYLSNKRLFTVKARSEKPKVDKNAEQPDEKTIEEAKEENGLKSLFDTKLIKEGLNYLKKIIRHISPKYLHLYGTYGFDDPSLTGMTAGFIYTLQGTWPQSRIQLQPCFTDEILELDFKAAGQVSAGKLAWDTARFLFKKDIRAKIFKNRKKVKPNQKK